MCRSPNGIGSDNLEDNDRDISYEVSEWWDSSGTYYDTEPSDGELLDEARQITVHVWDSEGNDIYFTSFSDDGWTEDELDADVDDAYEGYTG
jgi:hypothetical protein